MTLITNRYYADSSSGALEYALAHEIAHQWWYGLVGSDQILRAWQDESLSQYSPVFYYERFRGKAEGQRILNAYMQNSFRAALDAGRDDIVDQSVYAWKDFNGYIWAVYNKGGMFYNAYRAKFGDAAFSRFARNYYDNNRYKFAGENDILEALKAGAGPGQEDEVTELFRHWFKAREGDKDR
jgi:aminopeptidase N